MANIDVMYSSKTDQWATPQEFFDELNKEFDFNLDPCSDVENHKCENYFTREQDGLKQSWGGVSRILQSSVWKRNWQMGSKILGREPQAKHHCRYADTGKDRYKILPRLYFEQIRGTIC